MSEVRFALLPSKASCPNSSCYDFYFERPTGLAQHCVTKIETNFALDIPSDVILKIKSNNNPKWKILENFVAPDPHTRRVKFSIIAKQFLIVGLGHHLAHCELKAIASCFLENEGNPKFL